MHAHCSARVPSSDLRGPERGRPLVCAHVVCVTSAAWQENQLVSVVVAVLTDGDRDLAKMWTETSYIFSFCLPVGLGWGSHTWEQGSSWETQPVPAAIPVSGGVSDLCRWLELPICMAKISAKTYCSLLPALSLLYFCSLAVFSLDIWLPSIPAQLPMFALPWYPQSFVKYGARLSFCFHTCHQSLDTFGVEFVSLLKLLFNYLL